MEKQTQITSFEKSMKVIDEVVAIIQRIEAREANKMKEASRLESNLTGLRIQQR